MFARSLASLALISAFLFAPSAVGQISFYDIAAGAFASPTFNPTLSGGGPYTGFTVAQVFATPGIKVNVRGTSTTELVITDNNGHHYYNVSTGAFSDSNNVALSGGPYAGQTRGQVFASGALINIRTTLGSQLVITDASGNHYYNAVTGALNSSSNPTLSGGPYAGKTIGQLFTQGTAIGVRGGAQPNLMIADAAGVHLYDDSTGAFSASRNPTLTGGPFAGQTVGQAFIAGSFVDVRETTASELSLTPRTLPSSTTTLSASPSGTATLSSPVTLTATMTPSSATGKVAFFDGVEVLGYATLASGQATFTTRLLASGVHQLQAIYTGNGSVAVSTSSQASYTITSVPSVGFQAVRTYPAGNSQREIAIADIDRDGDADVVVVNALNPGTIQVLRNNGNGTFATATPITVHANPFSVAVGDFNEDGVPDIVVSNASGNDVAVILGNGNGTFQTPVYLAVDASGNDVEVADFNGDGHADIGVVVSNGFSAPNEYFVFLGNGNGTFQAKRDTATGATTSTYAVTGYFNSDSIVDVAVQNTGSVSVLLGDGTGGFNPAPGSPFSASAPLGIFNAGDIDGDGHTDLAFVANMTPNRLDIYLGSGTGQFSFSGSPFIGGLLRTLTSGDFDGDGRNDLVAGDFGNASGGSVRVLTGTPGSPYFSAGTPISVAPTRPSVGSGVADLNGDGRADIVVNDWPAAATGLAVLIAHGPPASIAPTAGTPQSALVGGPFGVQFQAVVKDSGGIPLPNISVTFTAPASGASGTFAASATVTTDANGVATAPQFTANSTPGTYVVDAFVAGVATPASFTLTNATPASIAVLSGSPQNRAITTVFGGMSVIVRDGAGNPLPGVTVTFVPPASGPSGTFSGATTATTNVNGVTSLPSTFTANSIVGTYALQAFVAGVATPASFILTNNPAYIHYYSSSSGSFSGSRGPLLTGGPMDGLYLSQVLGTGTQVDIRDGFASELYIFSATGAHKYDLLGGTGYANFNPTLSGGPYSGQTVGQVFSSGKILQARDTSGSNLVILGNAGAHLYDLTTGAFSSSNNPTLSGGPGAYAGQTLGALVSSGAHISIRDNSPQVAITDASGIQLYQLTTGVFSSTQNPTLTGGPHAGMTVGQAFSAGLVLRVKDTASTSLVLFDAPPAGPPATISATSGTPQSTVVGTAFAAPLKAEVRDAANRVTPGVNVTFAAPSSGASCSFSGSVTIMTDLNGIATAPTCTANSTAGTYNATAAVSGIATPANFSLTNTAGAPGAIAVVSGTPQSVQVNTAFPAPLVVVVRDSVNNPVPGVTVTFAAPSSGASAVLSSLTAITDASGQASITATANTAAGSYSVTASVSGVSTPAIFSLTNIQPPPSSISASGGGSQSASVNTAFGSPLVVTVRDSAGNPVSGATVTFTVSGSGASATLSSATATTDASGQASVTATANGISGSYTVTAAVAGVAGNVTFTLTNKAGSAAAMTISGGNSQSAQVNTAFANALQVTLKDSGGNPVPGVTVTCTAPASGASASFSSATAVTDANGVASITATANATTGSYSVTASASGGLSTTLTLTNTAGAPSQLTVAGGNSQSTQVNTAFGQVLQVALRDANGNPVPGMTVTFTPAGSGASAILSSLTALTNAQGIASVSATANSTAGTYSVTASISGAASPVMLLLTNTAGPPAQVVPSGGGGCSGGSSPASNQSTPVSLAFPLPLGVMVVDAGCNPVSGVTVTFAAPGSGASAALSAATAITNAQGIASVTATANLTAGSYFVKANVMGIPNALDFVLTNTLGPASTIRVAAGSAQSTEIQTAFANVLETIVRDVGGNPVPGAVVTFAVPGSGASALLSATTVVTNAQGRVSVAATANSTAGSYQVLASIAGGAVPASFSLTNKAGAPAVLVTGNGGTCRSGSGGGSQSAQVDTAFALPLSVTVLDDGCNPVAGVTVSFAAPASGASAVLSSSTAVANAQGVASVNAVANRVAGSYPATASVAGVSSPAIFNLTNTAGAPGSILPSEGTPQSAKIEAAFAKPLSIMVKDAQGNPAAGVTVTFTAPASGASAVLSSLTAVTDAQSIAKVAATANTVTGSYTVTAYVEGVAAPANFYLTNLPGTPAGVSAGGGGSACPGLGGALGGSTQSTRVNTLFPMALQVVVFDAKCNPVPGVTVTFAASGSGASAMLSASTAVTDAEGIAKVYAKANDATGSYQASASVSGVSATAVFQLTNTAANPATITAVAGTPQSAQPSVAFSQALVARVRDGMGFPVAGMTVTFVPAGDAVKLSATTATTDAQGEASVTATAGNLSGQYVVMASANGVSSSALFYLSVRAAQAGGSVVQLSAVTDAANFRTTSAPGALMTIFGANLANQEAIAKSVPLPFTLSGVVLTVNGRPAPLLYVSPTQINFQMPQDLELRDVNGVRQADVRIVVTREASSNEIVITVRESAPGIFAVGPEYRHAAAENADFSVNTAANPAAPDGYILMFATGQGANDPYIETGLAAPADPLSHAAHPVTATIGGRSVTVQFAGPAPGYAGLLQVNLLVPDDMPAGEHEVILTINGLSSKPATIHVGSRP